MTTTAIEREANLRAQKKKILQRLKHSSATTEITDGSVVSAGKDTPSLFDQEELLNLRRHHRIGNGEDTKVACREKVNENLKSRLPTVYKTCREVDKSKPSKIPRYVQGNKSIFSSRTRRQYSEEAAEVCDREEAEKETINISLVVDTTEPEQSTPSSPSAPSQYHRKKTEIRKKAHERRRNVVSPSSSAFDIFSNDDDYLTVYDMQPRRCTSLTELDYTQKRNVESKRTNTSCSLDRNKNYGSKSWNFKEPFPIPRTSSWSLLYELTPTTEKEEINFQWFARRQQERLEDNLRRVEQNLDSTFNKLRKYVKPETALGRAESSENT